MHSDTGNFPMPFPIKGDTMNFFLIPNEKKDAGLPVAASIVEKLVSNGADVYFDGDAVRSDAAAEQLRSAGAKSASSAECMAKSDISVVIGGDGTILKAAKLLYGKNIPIVGVNLGKVGYMTELEVGECGLLASLKNGCLSPDALKESDLLIDERMMLSCEILRGGKIVYTGVCLNEAVVAKGDIARMIDLELLLDGERVSGYQCDGVIVSTPTGSTAYAMSAGGAVIDPKIECIGVIPLSPYLCIHSGPIIFSKDSEIALNYRSVRGNTAYLSTDGEEGVPLCDGDRILVSAAKYTTKLLRFKKTGFYRLLNTKLTNRILELADQK